MTSLHKRQRLHSTCPPHLMSAPHQPSTGSTSPFFSGLLKAFCSRDTFQTCLVTIQCLALCITPLVSKISFIVSNHPSASLFPSSPLAASWLKCGSPDWLYVISLDNVIPWLWFQTRPHSYRSMSYILLYPFATPGISPMRFKDTMISMYPYWVYCFPHLCWVSIIYSSLYKTWVSILFLHTSLVIQSVPRSINSMPYPPHLFPLPHLHSHFLSL